ITRPFLSSRTSSRVTSWSASAPEGGRQYGFNWRRSSASSAAFCCGPMLEAAGAAGLRGASASVSMPLRKSLPSSEPLGLSALPLPEARAGASFLGLGASFFGAGAAAAGLFGFSGAGFALGGAGFSGAGFGFGAALGTSFLGGAGLGLGG